MEAATSLKEENDIATQLALAGVTGPAWTAPQAHMSLATMSSDVQQMSVAPPPAHAHSSSTNPKPPDSFLDKSE